MSGGVCSNLIQPTGIGGGETGKMSVNEGLMFSVLVLFSGIGLGKTTAKTDPRAGISVASSLATSPVSDLKGDTLAVGISKIPFGTA